VAKHQDSLISKASAPEEQIKLFQLVHAGCSPSTSFGQEQKKHTVLHERTKTIFSTNDRSVLITPYCNGSFSCSLHIFFSISREKSKETQLE